VVNRETMANVGPDDLRRKSSFGDAFANRLKREFDFFP
jgi:hypothetical protein